MRETGVSYFGNRILKHYRDDLNNLKKMGCSFILHTFSEADYTYFRKTMSRFIKATHDKGLKVWVGPWGVMGLFGGEAFSTFVSHNLASIQILNDGRRAPAMCPNRDETRQLMKKWIDAAIEIGADTIFWDEPHFYIPSTSWDIYYEGNEATWACRCDLCRSMYFDQYGEDMPVVRSNTVQEFRKNSILRFVADMSAYVHENRKENAICVIPVSEDEVAGIDWNEIAALPTIDSFGVSPYWYLYQKNVEPYVQKYANKVVEVCRKHGKRSHLWIQTFGVPMGREDEISTAIEIARQSGIETFATWGYGASEVLFGLENDQPNVVWETVSRKFHELRKDD